VVQITNQQKKFLTALIKNVFMTVPHKTDARHERFYGDEDDKLTSVMVYHVMPDNKSSLSKQKCA
jgi:hypothetical protein